MFEFELSVTPVAALAANEDHVFRWNGNSSTSTIASNIGPLLGDFGPVRDRNIDFVRIASGVLAADRSAPRSGSLSRWNQREISLTVEVTEVDPWKEVGTDLEALLGFLTGDTWHLGFRRGEATPEQVGRVGIDADRVVLLSGGADSAVGGLLSALELGKSSKKHVLVSHWSSSTLSPIQSRVANTIERLAPGASSDHIKVHHSRSRTALTGKRYGTEHSTRSRSLLFISLGLAVASVNEVPLWIPENGYASINPPLSFSRRGSLSTKTTHPKFFQDLRAILERAGAHFDLMNPFADLTKGEMFSRVVGAVGMQQASEFLGDTTSCSHTGARSYGISPKVACGVCFGCVLRRASFHAANLTDPTTYLIPADQKQVAWLEDKTVIPAMKDFLGEDFGVAQLARLQIPSNILLAQADKLVQRGRAELRGLGL
ncbi:MULTISPECIES: hypothetical protein [unclassified Frondihabitans]|uniref:hypothetical protein n=1 Tax=unclassified Frondihabitans TaxID=2626248 RepID=UPI000F4E0C3F|nr:MULTISPECIES: hypothetical protein [unclassified Frondihabitans]RPE76010.1 7-cyano-7-deazaguanine synthase in queuosine biosynthesis [Frondihabitans sp. PhB153]RPF05713.1 7-cyano-7-deazaguanine synthase in queuosine biosynthesis [Frondihabitans sp. PhB161]